jgi:hypothetical protein
MGKGKGSDFLHGETGGFEEMCGRGVAGDLAGNGGLAGAEFAGEECERCGAKKGEGIDRGQAGGEHGE